MIANFVQHVRRSWNKNEQQQQSDGKPIIERVRTSNGKTLDKVYIKKKLIGKGAFAECFITENTETKKQYATKIISKEDRNRSKLLNELLIHQLFHHDNIVDFSHAFEDKDNIYVFMELCVNDTLEHLLKKKRFLTTKEIQPLLVQIIQGLTCIHSKNVVHRDLKPRNIFLGVNNQVKIGDFGLAAKLEFNEEHKRNICGTPQYMPPEMVEGRGYGKEADIWALGILVYEMYTGRTPYTDLTNEKIMDNICNLNFNYSEKGIPKEGLALIKRILIKNPQLRPSLKEILESPFFGYQENQTLNMLISPRKSEGFNLNFETPKTAMVNMMNSPKNNYFHSVTGPKKMQIPMPYIYVVEMEELNNQILMYQLNNMSVGVLKRDCEVLTETIKTHHIILQQNGKAVVSTNVNNVDSLLLTTLDYFKKKCKKQVKIGDLDRIFEDEVLVYVNKSTKYRNCYMLRLSNQTIQLKFADKTNILINLQQMDTCKYIDSEREAKPILTKYILSENQGIEGIDEQKLVFTRKVLFSINCKLTNIPRNITSSENTRVNSEEDEFAKRI